MYKKQKHYSYFTDDNNKRKKAKGTKKCVIKIKLKFENYETYLEATQLENKINHLEKKKNNVGSLRENFKKSSKSIH